jgi:hypothetical protein
LAMNAAAAAPSAGLCIVVVVASSVIGMGQLLAVAMSCG